MSCPYHIAGLSNPRAAIHHSASEMVFIAFETSEQKPASVGRSSDAIIESKGYEMLRFTALAVIGVNFSSNAPTA